MKSNLLVTAVLATFLLFILATAVMAQEETPPPYAGLKNPFLWSDAPVQEAGERLYQSSCLGCHGADGSNIAGADFGTADFPQSLEEKPDFYFWLLSEGRLDKGMPPFKSSLSEEQRWQVLTYLWSLGAAAAPPEVTLPSQPPAEREGDVLLLAAPEHAQSMQPLTLTAILRDKQGEPIKNDTVKFFIKADG
jgi:mono/diheme cytochrome c family protein